MCGQTDKKKLTMRPLHTHYDNLKVARNAPPEVIRAAYKTLCHKFHPDRHGGSASSTQTFQLITAAYEVLSDAERRQQHDAWIARAEIQHTKTPAEKTIRPWNGLERRRLPWPVSSSPKTDRHGRMRITAAVAALWASVALVGTMLFLIYQS